MTSKIYAPESFTRKIQEKHGKAKVGKLQRGDHQIKNIREETNESSGSLDQFRSGQFDPMKTLNSFTQKMEKDKEKKKKIFTKKLKQQLVQPRVNGIPMIPDLVVDPKQLVINHDINFDTARLISSARSF